MGHAKAVQEFFNFLTPGELDLLQALAVGLPSRPTIVNIGAGYGTSALSFIEARPDCVLYTVDNRAASHPDGSLENERAAFAQAGMIYLLNHQWFQVLGDSKQVGRTWLAKGLPAPDLVFVDGDHSYAGCAGDIDTWLPNLSVGGVMAIHDYDKAANDPREHGRNNPFPEVDAAVYDRLVKPGYPLAGRVDTTIAFRKDRA